MTKPYTAVRPHGFTLLEVLIAITITALIGLGSWQLLNSAIKTYEIGQKSLEKLSLLQRAQLTIARDFRQISPRAIRDEYGDYQAALSSGRSTYVVEFSRVGWRNPLQESRSEVQRVAYEVVDGDLIRLHWNVIDRAQDSVPVSRRLLTGVESFEITYLNESKAWVDEWPPQSTGSADETSADPLEPKAQLPKAVRVSLTHPYYGELDRIFDFPEYVTGAMMQAGGANSGTDPGESANDPANTGSANSGAGP